MLKLFHLFSMRLDPVQRRKVVIHQPHHVCGIRASTNTVIAGKELDL
jgi:hypothetical protein